MTTALAGPTATIHLDAVAANTARFASLAPLIAVVKADGFGHGALDVARAALAAGATSLGVTSLEEAAELRDGGVRAPILAWLLPPATDLGWALRHDVHLAVSDMRQLAAVAEAARATSTVARVHLHVDLGMHREAAAPSTWLGLFRLAHEAEAAGLVRAHGLMGHLPDADAGPRGNDGPLRSFERAHSVARRMGLRPTLRHLGATSGALHDPRTRLEAIRVGAGLVGIDPAGREGLVPAMTFRAPVVAVHRLAAGEAVGYGHTWRADRGCTVASLQAGYADGVPRGAVGAQVQLGGRRREVVGRVSMDQVVVLLDDDHAAPGDEAILWGPGTHGEPTTRDWATWAGTIEHEVVTGLGRRVRRQLRSASVPAGVAA